MGDEGVIVSLFFTKSMRWDSSHAHRGIPSEIIPLHSICASLIHNAREYQKT
jgi:hypothetical protein